MKRYLRSPIGIAVVVAAGVLAAGGGSGQAETTPIAGGSCQTDLAVIRAVPQRVEAAWAANDADAVAAAFTADTDFVIGDGTFLRGHDEVHEYMAAAFETFLKGTSVTAPVDNVRCLSRTVGVVHTRGGILLPGETDVPPERQGIQVFVATKHGGEWLVDVYQNTRISPPE